jgi:flagella basal body P-ring formation protein FlgA
MSARHAITPLLAAMLLVLAAGAARADGGLRVSIPARSAVEEEWIYLGRIARVEGQDPELVERLQRLPLANAPPRGQTRWLDCETVRRRLKQSGIEPGAVRLQAPERFAVTRGATAVDSDRIREAVMAHLTAAAPADAEALRVARIETESGIVVPPGELSLRVVPGSEQRRPGKLQMALEIAVDRRVVRRTWATAELDQQVELLVAARPLPKGRLLVEEDLAQRSVAPESLPAGAVASSDAALGMRVRRAVPAGGAISGDLLERPLIVKRGDPVQMLIEAGGLRISAMGIAQRAGRQGERIVVENVDSRKRVLASVLDARTVKVAF